MSISIIDNTDEILSALNRQIEAGLEAVGQQAASHAKRNISKAGRIASGTMMNSIESRVQMAEKAVYVGTNNEYAPYHEVGTGIYADSGSGRKTKWRYKDANGNWHTTNGIRPIHFLKNAAAEHQSEYGAIIKEYLEK